MGIDNNMDKDMCSNKSMDMNRSIVQDKVAYLFVHNPMFSSEYGRIWGYPLLYPG